MPDSAPSSSSTDLDLHPFGVAMASRDIEAAAALLSIDVTFHSPIVFTPYRGRVAVTPILQAVANTLTDFRFVWSITAGDAGDVALVFQARVGGRQIQGCDLLRLDQNGLIAELTVLVRPLSAAQQLATTMTSQLAATARR